jgi:hypothetical protein
LLSMTETTHGQRECDFWKGKNFGCTHEGGEKKLFSVNRQNNVYTLYTICRSYCIFISILLQVFTIEMYA